MHKDTLKKLTKPFIFPFAIAIIVWEQLFYKPIYFISSFIERNKIIHIISDKIRHSHPYIALLILTCCGLPLIPFKMAGIYLIGHGYTLLGMGTFGLAKIIGGAISVQIFNLTEPAIRKINFVNVSLNWLFAKKNTIKKVLTESSYYIVMQSHIQLCKVHVKNFFFNHLAFKKFANVLEKKFYHKEKFLIHEKTTIVSVNDSLNAVSTTQITFINRITAKTDYLHHYISCLFEENKSLTTTVVNHSIKQSSNENDATLMVNKDTKKEDISLL